jgi:hypothetical protein
MKSWIFLAAASVKVMVKGIPLLLLSRQGQRSHRTMSPRRFLVMFTHLRSRPLRRGRPVHPSFRPPAPAQLRTSPQRNSRSSSRAKHLPGASCPQAPSCSACVRHTRPANINACPTYRPRPLPGRCCRQSRPRRTETALPPALGGLAGRRTTVSESSNDRRFSRRR